MKDLDFSVKHWQYHAGGAASILAVVAAVYATVVRPRLASGARAAEARQELSQVRAEAELHEGEQPTLGQGGHREHGEDDREEDEDLGGVDGEELPGQEGQQAGFGH